MLIPLIILPLIQPSAASCRSKIFCKGPLLRMVQTARIFTDSKTFVDLSSVADEETTLQNFKIFSKKHQKPTRTQIKHFVQENFKARKELIEWVPEDFVPNPDFLKKISNRKIKRFAKNLVNIWPKLARKINPVVLKSPDSYTILPVENGFIIPGGRFREFYYWDSYWIVQGLLVSGMHKTVKGILDNFISMVKKYGFVPNGSRIYYLNRSQPPLLSHMVAEYLAFTNDTIWLGQNIDTLEKEIRFFLTKRTTEVVKNGKVYHLARYNCDEGTPRPESYIEDVTTASFFREKEKRIELYKNLKSATESGWDFSSRWFSTKDGTNLTFTQTRHIIPVDLNAFLERGFRELAKYYTILGNNKKARFWLKKADVWKTSIEEVFFDKNDGVWYDWDNVLRKPRKNFYISNLIPLWTMTYNLSESEKVGERAVAYLENQKVLRFEGGIPASLVDSGQQWDFPNAWPPLQAMVISGLDQTRNFKAKKLALELARKWIKSNMLVFDKTKRMYEKYNVISPAKSAKGGEYEVQTGFGWSNGVVLQLISRYYVHS